MNYLDLGRNELKVLNFVNNIPLLRTLILYENQIEALEPIELPLLKELWLNGNKIKNFNFLKTTPLLEHLSLEDNNITTVKPFNCKLLKKLSI